jgi:hypothetical protein
MCLWRNVYSRLYVQFYAIYFSLLSFKSSLFWVQVCYQIDLRGFFVCVCGGVVLWLARQVLYQLSHAAALFALVTFGIGSD